MQYVCMLFILFYALQHRFPLDQNKKNDKMESQTIKCKKFYLNIAICVKEKHFSMTFSSKLTMRRRHTGWVMPIWIQSCTICFPQHINEHITTHIQHTYTYRALPAAHVLPDYSISLLCFSSVEPADEAFTPFDSF